MKSYNQLSKNLNKIRNFSREWLPYLIFNPIVIAFVAFLIGDYFAMNQKLNEPDFTVFGANFSDSTLAFFQNLEDIEDTLLDVKVNGFKQINDTLYGAFSTFLNRQGILYVDSPTNIKSRIHTKDVQFVSKFYHTNEDNIYLEKVLDTLSEYYEVEYEENKEIYCFRLYSGYGWVKMEQGEECDLIRIHFHLQNGYR